MRRPWPSRVSDLLARRARLDPDRPAVVSNDVRLTYAELDDRVNAAGRMLHSLRVHRGDRVAVLARNSIEYLELYFAAAKRYRNVSVLDISSTAIEVARKRVGGLAQYVTWLVADVTQAVLPSQHYDVWHDRAVFHFLTTQDERTAYVQRVARSMKVGGHVIVATFGPEGPTKCSGLDVVRYDICLLRMTLAAGFRLPREINRRRRRVAGSHLMRIVAVLARRRIVMSGLEREAVDAGIETFHLPRVARCAVHRQHRLVVVGMLRRDVRVATDAGIRPVRGQF